MPATVHPLAPRRARQPNVAVLATAALLLLAGGARAAADGHAAPARPAAKPTAEAGRPAADHGKSGAAPRATAGTGAAADPMDTLREKLASKLGASKAPEAPTPYVMRVVSKAGSQDHGAVATAQKPAKPAGQGTATQVARLRADKAAAGHQPDGHAAHWGYGGSAGPEHWGLLKPEFATCANGTRQSPIDIRSGVKVDLEPIQFDYRPSGFRVVDNGHTIQVNLEGGNSIEVQGRRYDLLQFHFHRPSEERINGRQFDMVAHLVHKDAEGRLAVVAVLLDRGASQPVIQNVWNALPLEKGEEQAAPSVIDLKRLLPEDKRYFTYMGSLTTPPCSEGVLWMVMKTPVNISPEQINIFARLYPMNARPIQQVSGRLIKESN